MTGGLWWDVNTTEAISETALQSCRDAGHSATSLFVVSQCDGVRTPVRRTEVQRLC
jgi:hypothetical protein